MNHRHSADPLLSRSEHWGKVIDVDMLVHRPMNDLEIVSAHERDGELRPGCQLYSSRHTGFDDTQHPDDWHGGAQPESTHLTNFRASSRRSADQQHRLSTTEAELFHAGLNDCCAAALRNDLVEPEPRYERSNTGHLDPPVAVSFSIPVPKVNPPQSTEADLRPISLTLTLGKVLESFVGSWILQHVDSQLESSQYGALKSRLTTHALVDMLHYWYKAID